MKSFLHMELWPEKTDAQRAEAIKKNYRRRWLWVAVAVAFVSIVAAVALVASAHLVPILSGFVTIAVDVDSCVPREEHAVVKEMIELNVWVTFLAGGYAGGILMGTFFASTFAVSDLFGRKRKLLIKYYEIALRSGLLDHKS